MGSVYPELVSTDAEVSLNYTRLSAVLVEAVKEQQQLIRRQATTLAEALRRIDRMEAALRFRGSWRRGRTTAGGRTPSHGQPRRGVRPESRRSSSAITSGYCSGRKCVPAISRSRAPGTDRAALRTSATSTRES